MRQYEPRSFKEGFVLGVLLGGLCGSLAIGAKLGGWYWIIPVLGVPLSLYGMWRVGGWE